MVKNFPEYKENQGQSGTKQRITAVLTVNLKLEIRKD